MNSSLYEQDVLRWTEQKAALLRAGRLADLDDVAVAAAYG
jgi:hypothetical protein